MQRCIIILGMHRSGTSALTGCLKRLGVHLGSKLMPPQAGVNDKGFFEDEDIVQEHEILLRGLGRAWDDLRPLPENWLYTRAAKNAKQNLGHFLRSKFSQHPLCAVKDPRLCRLVPLWEELLSELSVAPIYLIPWREPSEVAFSLRRRNGFCAEKSGLLWAAHILEAEGATRKSQRYFVEYNEILENPATVFAEIAISTGISWPNAIESSVIQLRTFIDRKLCHSAYDKFIDTRFARSRRLVDDLKKILNRRDPTYNKNFNEFDNLYSHYLKLLFQTDPFILDQYQYLSRQSDALRMLDQQVQHLSLRVDRITNRLEHRRQRNIKDWLRLKVTRPLLGYVTQILCAFCEAFSKVKKTGRALERKIRAFRKRFVRQSGCNAHETSIYSVLRYPGRRNVNNLRLRPVSEDVTAMLKNGEFVVALSHDDYLNSVGGLQTYLHDEEKALAENNISFVQLFPKKSTGTLSDEERGVTVNIDGRQLGTFDGRDVGNLLGSLSQQPSYNCVSLELHQLMGWSIPTVRSILREVKANYRFFWIHDFFSICPQQHLFFNDKHYCHAPSLKSNACTICVYGEERGRVLPQFKDFLSRESFYVAAPSEFAIRLWKDNFDFPNKHLVLPHVRLVSRSKPNLKRANDVLRSDYLPKIAFIGHRAPHKGWNAWREFVDKCDAASKYRLYHFGEDKEYRASERFVKVSVGRDDRNAMVTALRQHSIDFVFHWSLVPETFSYVLYETIAGGAFPLVHIDSGNVADFVARSQLGRVFEKEIDLHDYLRSAEKAKQELARLLRSTPQLDLQRNVPAAKIVTNTKSPDAFLLGALDDSLFYFGDEQLSSEGPGAVQDFEAA